MKLNRNHRRSRAPALMVVECSPVCAWRVAQSSGGVGARVGGGGSVRKQNARVCGVKSKRSAWCVAQQQRQTQRSKHIGEDHHVTGTEIQHRRL